MIKSSQKRNANLKLIASTWSPPAFMKDNHNLYGGGKLLASYKKLWSQYLIKFVQSYEKQGVPISYMTLQNEPNAKQIWESCLYTSEEEADLLKNYLFPTFQKNGIGTQFLIWDHNKDRILERSIETLIDYQAFSYAKRNSFSLVYRWAF